MPADPAELPTPGREVAITLLRKKWLILGFALLGGALAGLSALARPPIYSASTQIIVESAGGGATGATPQDVLDSTMDSHLTMLTSDAHLRHVLAALREGDAQRAATAAEASPPSPGFSGRLAEALRAARASAGHFLRGLLSGGATSPPSPEAADTAARAALKANLRVGQELRSRIITIGFTDPNPEQAARVANLVASVYVDNLAQHNRELKEQALAGIEESLPVAQRQLANAASQLDAYRLTQGAGSPAGSDTTGQEITLLGQQIALLEADLAETTRRIDKIQALRQGGAPAQELAAAIGSPALDDLAARGAPAAGSGGAAAATTDPAARLAEQVDKAIAHLDEQGNMDRTQLALLRQRRDALNATANDVADRLSGLRALELQVEVASRRYNDLLSRQQELVQQIASAAPGVAVWSEAWPPTRPTTLSSAFLIPPGMVVFGILGALFVILRHRSDPVLRSEAAVEAALKIPCVGLLPRIARPQAQRLSRMLLAEPQSIYTRALRSLLVSLGAPDAGLRLPNVLLITSSNRQEGKTTLAWSIALAAARLGETVLFLDLDMRDGPLTREFRDAFSRTTSQATLAEALQGTCPLADAIEEMPDIGIHFIPSPGAGCDLLPLMTSPDAASRLEPLREAYALVVIDGPSASEGPEARLATAWADAVLFAVRWGTTEPNLAREALASLGAGPFDDRALPIASVLTQVNLKQHAGFRFGDSGDLLLAGQR
ncbi:GumC family protein [Kaistia adipata]|uniref:GumC family protein n=1 Tax=Kaistia adipata TaxID=166954 RepID=UPI001FE238B6|nr:tyrosine-protein kinase domain-containing protein [Kaistia adipata]